MIVHVAAPNHPAATHGEFLPFSSLIAVIYDFWVYLPIVSSAQQSGIAIITAKTIHIKRKIPPPF